MQILNLKQLEAFCAVVERGGFTAAAESLYLAQSTVSGHVSALETELGVSLLARTGKRSIVLTEEGRRVYEHARAILRNCAELSQELEEHSTQELTIAASSVPMQYILPQKLATFSLLFPSCRFTLRDADSERVHDLLLHGEAHLGFAGAKLDEQRFHYDPIAEDTLVLVAPDIPKYRALHARGASGNELLNEPLLFREGGSGTQLAGQRFLTENNIRTEQLYISARFENSEALLRAVGCGMGCAVISSLAAAHTEGVLSFPLVGKNSSRTLYMLRAKDRKLTRAGKSFAEFMTMRN